VVDAGTGDGRALVRDARRDPHALYVGVEIDARTMAASARRAAARPARGGCPNARFVVSAVEAWPDEAAELANLVTVRYPWGSLLRGVLGRDPTILAGLARMLRAGGLLEVTLSIVERDGIAMPDQHELETAYSAAALTLLQNRSATPAEIEANATTWSRRLGSGNSLARPVTRLRAVRR
jgi:16S rRNA (adenine(1408)-N(1))-methyltransferase